LLRSAAPAEASIERAEVGGEQVVCHQCDRRLLYYLPVDAHDFEDVHHRVL